MVLLSIGIFFAHITNPFTSLNTVTEPYSSVYKENGQLQLLTNADLSLRSSSVYKDFALFKASIHIINNVYSGGQKARSSGVEDIIDSIHLLRFDPSKPYIISGDHFSIFYPRSLGIFYSSTLDPRTARSDLDWSNRQRSYLQSTAYALNVYQHSPTLSTTIVPLGENAVTLINIYAPPSDTLYSLLYALRVMQTSDEIKQTYPFPSSSRYTLQTTDAANTLLALYRSSLQYHLSAFTNQFYDPQIGLIKTTLLLSGAKDIAKRQGAFYDNVIFWKTNKLAQELGLIPQDSQFLDEYKQRILTAFWLPNEKHFLEDQSQEASAGKYYSSDWLITLMTGFLDPSNPSDLTYLEQSVQYIQAEKLDQPFGLHYQQQDRSSREYLIPRLFGPEYGGTAIWSLWGMEYIKLLALLFEHTHSLPYLLQAQHQLEAYTANIVKYRGFPEVYDAKGNMFRNLLYTSVRQTGWVVSFEQARDMVEAASSFK